MFEVKDNGAYLMERYNRAKESNIPLQQLDALALAGYYLKEHPTRYFEVLHRDVTDCSVPEHRGRAAEVILLSCNNKCRVG